MLIIVREKQSGKTEDLIRFAANQKAYMVVTDQDEASRVAKVAHEIGVDLLFPLTFTEFLTGQFYVRGIKAFVIDNVDMLLARMAHGVPVIAMSATEVPGGVESGVYSGGGLGVEGDQSDAVHERE